MDKFFYATVLNGNVKTFGDYNVNLGYRYASQGIFAEWDWDGKSLIARNDRYGYFPIYYGIEDGKFGISSSIETLLDLGFHSELDADAFSVFIRLGCYLAEDTPFRSIRALPPNAILVWNTVELKISSPGIIIPERQIIDRREAMKIYDELFKRSIAKSLDKNRRIALPLSGGRDSRHILLALASVGKKPDVCLTARHFPPRPDEDACVAAIISEAAGVEHRALPQSTSRFKSEIAKNRLSGYTADEHSWYLTLKPYANDGQFTFYDGIAGDVLSAGHFLNEVNLRLFKEQSFTKLAEDILGPEGYIPVLFTRTVSNLYSRERARQRLVEELVRHVTAPNPVGSFYFWNRTRRSVAMSPFRILGPETGVVMPFIENDVFDFLSTLPAEMFLDHTFHTEMITQSFPRFAHIRFEDKSVPLVPRTRHFRQFSKEILQFAFTRRKRKLLRRSFFISRCLPGIINSQYSSVVADFGERSVLLLQLERLR
jgi:asparagine synthase (glutamine-hydrolysing)